MAAPAGSTSTGLPDDVGIAAFAGFSLLPTKLDKRPCLSAWKRLQETAAGIERLEDWQRKFKPAGWAIVTGKVSGLVILDFTATDGEQTRERLGLPVSVRTPSGGSHTWVIHPGSYVATRNCESDQGLGERFPGMDVRGDGGYAVFTGSNAKGDYTLVNPQPVPFQ